MVRFENVFICVTYFGRSASNGDVIFSKPGLRGLTFLVDVVVAVVVEVVYVGIKLYDISVGCSTFISGVFQGIVETVLA